MCAPGGRNVQWGFLFSGIQMSNTDLFGNEEDIKKGMTVPLATRMRPNSFDEFVGQDHILSSGSLLRRMIESDRLTSIILYGPPGTGKTSLAHIIAATTRASFQRMNAVSSGVSEIRESVRLARNRLHESGQKTILFIDEIHRFNKVQQEALLPDVEEGYVVLIGTTVENPFFYIVSPLMSRSNLFELKALSEDSLRKIARRALTDTKNGFGSLNIEIEEEAVQFWIDHAEGDARRFLNGLEVAVLSTPSDDDKIMITQNIAAESIQRRIVRHDRSGDHHYNIVSAFIKSMRGSDPDASLYWFARMLDGGVDPLYVARRVVRMASEDIGNADPRGLQLALNAWDVQERLGSPEGELAIAQAIVYLACAPKSNAVYMAYNSAMGDARSNGSLEVPVHLRNAPTKLMKELGYGREYRYAHDEHEAYAAGETYFPEEMTPRHYYQPVSRGLEQKITEKLAHLRELDRLYNKENK